MASPFWTDPGENQGRVAPSHNTATEGTYAYILGFDQSPESQPSVLLNIGDDVTVEQNISLAGRDYISFSVEAVPQKLEPETLLTAGACEFKNGALLSAADVLLGVILGTPEFTAAMQHRTIRVTNTLFNNGDFRISAVPMDQGLVVLNPALPQIENGRVAVLEPAMAVVNEIAAAATIRLLGARLILQVYMDALLLYELREPHSDGPVRMDHRINVSKINGVHAIKFRAYLEEVA